MILSINIKGQADGRPPPPFWLEEENQAKEILALAAVLRIGDVYPESRILIFIHPESRIPDPGYRTPDPKKAKEKREKNLCSTIFCSQKYHKILFLNWWRKIFGPILNLKRII